jgi:CheY-like chemotaxis protein
MANSNHVIILVDDDEEERMFFSEALQELKVEAELLLFENGHKLMDYMAKFDQISVHIFLDLNMPKLSGLECLKKLRELSQSNNSFITIYSTSSSHQDIENAYVNGANCYLKKPSTFKDLKKLIQKAIDEGYSNNGKQLPRDNFFLNNF